jgi:SpoIID/LytB domain protein
VDRSDPFGRALTLRLDSDTPSPKAAGSLLKPAKASPVESTLQTAAAPTPPASDASTPLNSKSKTIRATGLRSLLGVSVLKSTFFTVSKQGDVVRFEGRGYGHGVGMCLAGANGMAKAGIDYRDILSRYYNGTSLVQLYETLPPSDSTGEEN